MRGNKKQSVPDPKKYVVIPKKQFKKFLNVHQKWAENTMGLRREMRGLIEEEVEKNLENKVHQIDSTLTEAVIHKELLIEMGIITREQVNKKYTELRKKRK